MLDGKNLLTCLPSLWWNGQACSLELSPSGLQHANVGKKIILLSGRDMSKVIAQLMEKSWCYADLWEWSMVCSGSCLLASNLSLERSFILEFVSMDIIGRRQRGSANTGVGDDHAWLTWDPSKIKKTLHFNFTKAFDTISHVAFFFVSWWNMGWTIKPWKPSSSANFQGLISNQWLEPPVHSCYQVEYTVGHTGASIIQHLH